MKLPLLLSLGLLTAAASVSRADVNLTFSDLLDAPDSVTISPGDSFDVTLTFESTAELASGLAYLLEADGSGSGFFQITGRDLTNSAFPDVITDNSIALSPGSALLDGVNDNELGGLTASDPLGTGSFFVARFTIQALGNIAPGTYTIGTNGAEAYDENFDTLAISRPTYTINVVPEPGATALTGLALATTLLRRRRR